MYVEWHTKRRVYKNTKTYNVYHCCLCFIFDQPTANFGNQRNLQITDCRLLRCVRNAWFPIAISIQVPWDGVFVVIFFQTMYNKTIIRFGFCDILNNQSLGKCYQPWPSPRLITLALTLLFRISQKPHPINVYYLWMGYSGTKTWSPSNNAGNLALYHQKFATFWILQVPHCSLLKP